MSLRVPGAPSGAEGQARAAPESERPSLRLALAKGTLGLELDAAYRIEALTVTELALRFTGVRFPIDLSGGVARFRHRRGVLDRAAIELRPSELAAWAARSLRGILSEATPELLLAPIEAGALVGISNGQAALAFDVIVAPGEGHLRLIPMNARGLGIGAPPHVLALRALSAVSRPIGRVVGGAVVAEDAVGELVRRVLPDAGCRAPSVTGARWEPLDTEAGRFRLVARAEQPPPELSSRSIRALELAELAAEADEAAFRGDFEGARGMYLTLLERAPRHREISERLAWIDAIAGERSEAALATLVDAVPATDAGLIGGELLEAVGDRDGAVSALSNAAHLEPYGALAALTWMRVGAIAEDFDVRLRALDEAVTRAPGLEPARWARLSARLEVADARGARADAEHLEAVARGVEARHAVWRRAAGAFLERGFVAEAGALFERALRYAPESSEAVAGLARSLRAAGKARRALDLFARAAALEARRGNVAHGIELELARSLVEVAGDRPAAVARVRRVPPGIDESFEARFLEGRWRAELGDLAGAAVAFGRLRDEVERATSLAGDRAAAVAAMLVEAAQVEERDREDLQAAQRHLGLALRLRPRDRAIAALFRRVAGEVARAVKVAPRAAAPEEPELEAEEDTSVDSSPGSEPAPPSAPVHELSDEGEALGEGAGSIEDAEAEAAPDEAVVERLTDRVRANPGDHEAVLSLADALERLGRHLDLLALLSARMEEGGEDVRRELAPRRRAVLEALAEEARAEGRASEAELYEMMAAAETD
jgi:tetratricopeptide (TPR) repeat protein